MRMTIHMAFDRSNPNWSDQEDFFEYWIKYKQSYLKAIFRNSEVIYLNKIYAELGMWWDYRAGDLRFDYNELASIRFENVVATENGYEFDLVIDA